jgi:Ca2+-binding RTX toxin-like protein
MPFRDDTGDLSGPGPALRATPGEPSPTPSGPQSNATSAGDTIPDDTSTAFTLAIGGAQTGFVNTPGDDDWFRVELIAGQSYVFTSTGSGASSLVDPYLEIRSTSGQLLAIDDDGGLGHGAQLRFTADSTGTYFINARAWEADEGAELTGGYTLSAALGPPQNPLDTIDLHFAIPTLNPTYYFASAGEVFGGETATQGWSLQEMTAVVAALGAFSAITNLTFTNVNSSAGATFVFMLADLAPNVLGQASTTGGVSYVEFAPDGVGWSAAGRAAGGLGFATILHEIGHGLGLAHPHDNGGDSEIMMGVLTEFNSYGFNALNQGVFTMMSYNDGWDAMQTSALTYGNQATPSPLDIALLQQKYGANPTAHAGDNTYVLTTAEAPGATFQAIWDTGGTDAIVYAGAGVAEIDLRAATLLDAPGGGGFISSARAAASLPNSGFTIAAGVVIENAQGGTGDDRITGNEAANRLTGDDGSDVLFGNGGADTLLGGAGADDLDGGAGVDRMEGGLGADNYFVDSAGDVIVEASAAPAETGDAVYSIINFTLPVNVERLELLGNAVNGTGNASDNPILGNARANTLIGLGGDDTLMGHFGDDKLIGGAGADFIDGGGGIDTVDYSASSLGVQAHLGTTGSTGGDAEGDTLHNVENLIGSASNDFLFGDHLANVIAGRAGADSLDGGNDIDTADYSASAARVRVSLTIGTGLDADAQGDTLANIENLAGSAFDDILTGDAIANALLGAAGADTLTGGAGADVLNGGDGIDLADYAASAAGVRVYLTTGAGLGGDAQGDVLTSIESLIGTAFNDVFSGNASANTLNGGAARDNLQGLGGDDILIGAAGSDVLDGGDGVDLADYTASSARVRVDLTTGLGFEGDAHGDTLANIERLTGTAFNDSLTGNAAANALLGAAGADTLTGGAGADVLNGGDGIDLADYAASAAGVRVYLTTGAGLGGDAQGDVLTSVENLIGTAFNDVFAGNASANTLNGGAARDNLQGLGGDDLLIGAAGNDVLDGGDGVDVADYAGSAARVRVNLTTGTGLDADAQGDTLANIENLIGSAFNDQLTGNAGANVLAGRAGADALNGGDGVDTADYSTSAARVRVNLNAGTALDADAVGDTFVSIESLTGSAFNDQLTGNGGFNVLIGGAGHDQLSGLGGDDVLTGGAGSDAFIFVAALGAGNTDAITDFSAPNDTIWIDNAVFSGLASGALAASAFAIGASAADSDDRILYNAATGALMFDADGNGAGAAVQFASLAAGLVLTNADFLVI